MNGDLIERAKLGSILPAELEAVADGLRSGHSRIDPYTAIHALGLAQATQYRPVIEVFLEKPPDAMLARIALQTLCVYWSLTAEYRDHVLAIIGGVEWDDEDDARLVAISIGGEWLRDHIDQEIAEALLRVATDPAARRLLREAATAALARGLGLEHHEIPGPTARTDPDGAWARSIQDRARALTTEGP